jgi:serine beta-lactamase-like protein LACTB
VNAANVDNSYKWAGGGFLSNVTDLISFGNAMLYSYQAGEF